MNKENILQLAMYKELIWIEEEKIAITIELLENDLTDNMVILIRKKLDEIEFNMLAIWNIINRQKFDTTWIQNMFVNLTQHYKHLLSEREESAKLVWVKI